MPALGVTATYAGLLAVLMAVLSVQVGVTRGRHGVALGDGGKPALHLAMRRFGNFTEYVPMAVLLLALMEIRGVPAGWLHAYGGLLVLFRLAHPIALYHNTGATTARMLGRIISAAGTALLLLLGGITLIVV